MKRLVSAKGKREKPSLPYKRTVFRVILAFLLFCVVLLNLFLYVFSVVRYFGDGMEPTLRDGQTLVVNKVGRVEEGDVVAFYYNNKVLVRRVVCGGGKQISVDKAGAVCINGEELAEPYVGGRSLGQCDISFPYSVPPDHVFVMGDNRSIAMDSRLAAIGTVPKNHIIGKVILIV